MLKSHDEIVEELFKYDLIPVQVREENPHYWEGYKKTCEILKNRFRTTLSARDAEVREMVERMKKPLWNDDIKIHAENIIRHNLLDDILTRLNNNK